MPAQINVNPLISTLNIRLWENKGILSLSFGKLDYVVIFVVGKFHQGKFCHLAKILSLFRNEVFPDKVTSILPYPSTFV